MVRDLTPAYVRGNYPAHLQLGPGSQPPQPLLDSAYPPPAWAPPGEKRPTQCQWLPVFPTCSSAAQPKQRQGLDPTG